MSEIAVIKYEPKQYDSPPQVTPERLFALRVPAGEGQSPWVCATMRGDGIGGPTLFKSEAAARKFATAAKLTAFEVVELTRGEFYRLAGRALSDGFNVFFLNPLLGGKPLKQPLSKLFDYLPQDSSCPCGSGLKVTSCCLAKQPILEWPVVPLPEVPKEGAGKNEREVIPL